MTHAELEQIYEALARKIDAVGPARSELLLAKLVLLLAQHSDSADRVLRQIDEAALDLDHAPPS